MTLAEFATQALGSAFGNVTVAGLCILATRYILARSWEQALARDIASLNANYAEKLESIRQGFQTTLEAQRQDFTAAIEEKKNQWSNEAELQRRSFAREVEAFKVDLGFNAEMRRLAAARKFDALATLITEGRAVVIAFGNIVPADARSRSEAMQTLHPFLSSLSATEYLFSAGTVRRVRDMVFRTMQAQTEYERTLDYKHLKAVTAVIDEFIELGREELQLGEALTSDGPARQGEALASTAGQRRR